MATNLFNPNDNLTGRDGGPYLDQVELAEAEIRRAKVEDREPDFDNVSATAGVPLNTASRQAALAGVNNLPSQADRTGIGVETAAVVNDATERGLHVFATVPDDNDEEPLAEETEEGEGDGLSDEASSSSDFNFDSDK